MTEARESAVAPAGLMRAVVLFAVAAGVVVLALAMLLERVVWTDAASVASVRASAWTAVVVQVVTFTVARLVARQQVIVAWGLGVLLRFAVVAFWALLGIKAFGLLAGPALLSLVLFLFVSTLLEPIFLNVR